jgi:hypothetical protein
MRILFAVLACAALSGCSILRALDFGGDQTKPFEFRFGWERGIERSQAKPGGVDEHGVYKPETPEAEALLSFPDVHAGTMVVVQPHARITPIVLVEICEFKLWHLRWFSLQVGAGHQLAEVYLGKRLLAVLEITVGGWVGWDFEEDSVGWGVGGTLIRF